MAPSSTTYREGVYPRVPISRKRNGTAAIILHCHTAWVIQPLIQHLGEAARGVRVHAVDIHAHIARLLCRFSRTHHPDINQTIVEASREGAQVGGGIDTIGRGWNVIGGNIVGCQSRRLDGNLIELAI